MKKIAVIFPGVGYNKDRPLLYYAGSSAKAHGYELIHIDFAGIELSKDELKDHRKLLELLNQCLNRTDEALADIDLDSADKLLFISKSIGTVVATAYARKKELGARHLLFTPLEYISNFAYEGNGTVFYGNADPYASSDAIAGICANLKLEAHCVDGANHSLETGDILTDIDNLRLIMRRVDDLIGERDIYGFNVQAMDGSITNLSEYRDTAMLIVNTATGCGFTPQYEALENMYRAYKKDGFTVLDFPCNQFGKQAPGTSDEIHNFCTSRYDISFPQFKKIDVNGEDELELYTYLKGKQGFHGFGDTPEAQFMKKKLEAEIPGYENTSDIKWNFTKFLVDKNGEVVARFEPTEDMASVEEAVKRVI